MSLECRENPAFPERPLCSGARFAGGLTLGVGIWSMHFIGMLAMKMPMIMSYNLWLTLASMGVAVVASMLAMNIAVTLAFLPSDCFSLP